MTWRLIQDGSGTPSWNMAVDEALLRLVTCPVLRIYAWDRPAVSIGYFQSQTVALKGRDFVRRYTGGGLVDHSKDFTYTVILPKGHSILALSTTESYKQIHEAIVETFHQIQVPAQLAPCCDPEEKEACFQRAVKFDVVLEGVKLAGAAQRRTREGMLQQGSVLIADEKLRRLFAARFPGILLKAFQMTGELSEMTSEEREKAIELEKTRYSQKSWNGQK